MFGQAGSPTGIVHADVTLTLSKVKVTGALNFRKFHKPCMLAAMTASPLRGFLAFWFYVFAGPLHTQPLLFLFIYYH